MDGSSGGHAPPHLYPQCGGGTQSFTPTQGGGGTQSFTPTPAQLVHQPSQSMVPVAGRRAALPTPFVQRAVPAGFAVQYTEDGQSYLVRESGHDDEDEAAAAEHRRRKLPMETTLHEIGVEFGVGFQLYFDFLLFLSNANTILFALGLIPFIPHLINGDGEGFDVLFVSTFSSNLYETWFAVVILACLVSLGFGPLYERHVAKFFFDRNEEDHEDSFGESTSDRIAENRLVASKDRYARISVSAVLFLSMIAVSGIITYELTIEQDESNTESNAIAVSVVVLLFNMLWQLLCRTLTEFEKHPTWTSFRKYHTLKLFLFKVINVSVLFVAKAVAFEDDSRDQCVLDDVGEQLFFLLVLDITFVNVATVLAPWGQTLFDRKYSSDKSRQEVRPEFNLANEYLELLFRQYLVFLGFSSFPLIALFGVINNMVEFLFDKWRILQICRRPHRLRGSMKSLLSFFLVFDALLAILVFPYGAAWVLGQNNLDCGIFE